MGIRFNNPQRLDKPMCRQAFRPGQWNGVRVGGGNTYIQNNFYGMQPSYRGWDKNAWAAYEYPMPAPQQDSGLSTMGKIGLGVALVGKLMDVFGLGTKDKTPEEVPEEQGSLEQQSGIEGNTDPNTPSTISDEPAGINTRSTPLPDTLPTREVQSGFDWNSDFTITAHDEDNPTEPIKGKVTVDGEVKEGENPESFTVTDTGGTYKFVATGETRSDGKPIYECVEGPGGTKYTKGNQYALTSDGGTPQLIQYKDMAGWGTGVGKVKSS